MAEYKTKDNDYEGPGEAAEYEVSEPEKDSSGNMPAKSGVAGLSFDQNYDFDQGGAIYSSVVIDNGSIFFGACDGYLYCLGMKGKLKWKFLTGDLVTSTPLVWNGKVYVASYDHYLYCLDKKGSLLWKFITGGKITGCPVIVSGTIYFGCEDKYLYALNSETGEIIWKVFLEAEISNTCTVSDGMIYCGAYNGILYCINKGGKIVWKFQTGGVLGASGCCIITDKNQKKVSDINNRVYEGFPSTSEKRIYLGSSDSYIYCLNSEGKVIWKEYIGSILRNKTEFFGGKIYFGSVNGNFYCYDAIDGKKLWSYKTGGLISCTPLFDVNKVYIGSEDKNLYCFDAETGRLLWVFETGGEIYSSPVIEDDVLYFGSGDTHLYAIDINERKILWTFQVGNKSAGSFNRVSNRIVDLDRKVLKIWRPETKKISEKGAQFEGSNAYIMKSSPLSPEEGNQYASLNIYETSTSSKTKRSAYK